MVAEEEERIEKSAVDSPTWWENEAIGPRYAAWGRGWFCADDMLAL